MGEGKIQPSQNSFHVYAGHGKDEDDTPSATSSSSFADSTVSNGSSSSSSSDMADDATSCSSSEPLCDLSELMAQLPIKRGLSKFYQGKSQSYTSLSRVTSVEDLPKKETPCRKRMKGSKSYGGGLDSYKSYTLPKPTISKKAASKGSLSSLPFPSRRGSFLSTCCKPPLVPPPVQKNLGC